MNKLFLKISIILVLAVCIQAKAVSEKDVTTAASNWLLQNESFLHYGEFKLSSERFSIDSIVPINDSSNNLVMYVTNLKPIGFILFSTDERLKPVIGYSSERNFNFEQYSEDYFFSAIINDLSENLYKIRNSSERIDQTSENASKWNCLLQNLSPMQSSMETNEIYGPFLESDWGQGKVNGRPVYNYYSPNQWPAGCVATATAQILNYYKWPKQGVGSNSYSDEGTNHSANFGETYYDWANTLDQYETIPFNIDNQKAAGLLSYHCAVALEMDFEENGSTASTTDVPSILHDYFRASGHYKSESSTGFWTEMKNNMLDERPAIISIKASSNNAGHAAVVDGYFETNDYYHVNPGWYGSSNGWYDISDSWYMSGYDIVVGAAKGIVPSPQINEAERVSETSFLVSWSTSRYQKAAYYELQQARSISGPWTSVSNNITDTTFAITDTDLNAYYYKVRANRDSIWWDYSEVKKVQLGTERQITFQVDMTYRELAEGESIVIRGNIPPLAGNINSDAMIDSDSNNVYKLSLNFDYDHVGSTLLYRFFIDSPDGLIPESSNREHVITIDPVQVLPLVYFDNIVGVDEEIADIPNDFKLEQNYPNPFNPSTTIKYLIPTVERNAVSLQKSERFSESPVRPTGGLYKVSLKVYDILGREVTTLVNKQQSAGSYEITFNAENIPTGIYFYRLEILNEFNGYSDKLNIGEFSQSKSMLLLK
ncbi:MAG: C10 family peptidase [Bacteroidota bacterium]